MKLLQTLVIENTRMLEEEAYVGEEKEYFLAEAIKAAESPALKLWNSLHSSVQLSFICILIEKCLEEGDQGQMTLSQWKAHSKERSPS